MEEKHFSVTCLCVVLVFMSLGSTARGNTYDIPRWLRLRSDELQCPLPRGQFGHPRYCDFFLNCWDGRAVVGRCQHGLVFNEKIRACDYKYNVDCTGKGHSQDGPPSSSDPNCPMPFGTFVNPVDCTEYFACHAGRATSYKCPKGTYYSKAIGACDHQRPQGCPGDSQGSGPPGPISQTPPSVTESSSAPPSVNEEPQSPAPIQEIPVPSPGTSSRPPNPNEGSPTSPPVQVITGPPSETSSNTTISTGRPQNPAGNLNIPDEEIVGPSPPVAAGGTPTLAPTTVRPQDPFRPSLSPGSTPPFEHTPSPEPTQFPVRPKPQFIPQKPPPVIQETTTVTTTVSTERPQLPLNPKPIFRPMRPPVPQTTTMGTTVPTARPQLPLNPKPQFIPSKAPIQETTTVVTVSTERPTEPFTPKPPFIPVTPPISETTTTVPTKRPQAPYSPKPPLVPQKPEGEETTPPWSKPSLMPGVGPKPPLVPEEQPHGVIDNKPTPIEVDEATERPQAPFTPKPSFVPQDPPPPRPPSIVQGTSSPPPPEESIHESQSEVPPSTGPSTISNLKPKPPLMPQPDEEEGKPPLVDIGGVKPKPPFKPPGSGLNPSDPPPPKPPSLNPGLFKPQKPPSDGGPFDGSTTTPMPVDGEDDPHILFPFLPKFPDTFKCPVSNVMLPILGDCSSLIACISGAAHRLRCPQGNTFDLVRGLCGNPRNFVCPTEIPSFMGGAASVPAPDDLIYAYLPVSKFTQLLKLN